MRPAEGGPERILTSFAEGYFYAPIFSPDGKTLAFRDGAHRLWIVGTDGGEPKQVAQDKLNEIHDQAFSPDGRWLAFSLSAIGRRRDLVLYEIATGKLTRSGDGSGIDSNPGLVARRQVSVFHIEPPREPGRIGHRVRFRDPEVGGDIRDTAGARHGLAGRAEVGRGDSGASDDAAGKPRRGRDDKRRSPARTKADKERAGKSARRTARSDQADPDRPRWPDGARGRAADRCGKHRPAGRARRSHLLSDAAAGTHRRQRSTARRRRCASSISRRARSSLVTEDVDSYSLSLDGRRVLIRHEKDYTVLAAKADAAKDAETKKELSSIICASWWIRRRNGRRCSKMPGGSSATSSTRRS